MSASDSVPDLLDPELRVQGTAHAVAEALRRDRGPVVWCPPGHRPGYWAVLGHPEARAVLTTPAAYGSRQGTRPGMQRPVGARLPMHNLDPPEHRRVRRAANARLEASASELASRLHESALELVGACARRPSFDAVAELAIPLATRALATALGVPLPAAEAFAALSLSAHEAAGVVLERYPHESPADRRAAREANRRLFAHVAEVHRARPRPAPATPAPAAPDGLDDEEARGVFQLMVQAGWITMVDAIAGALEQLVETKPPVEIETATEELLRLAAPINQFARTVVQERDLGGHRPRIGEQVVVFFAAANRDPRVFTEPHRFDPERRPNPHLAFGAGPHRCPGAFVARSALRAMLEALTQVGVAPVATRGATRRRSSFLNGWERLPLRFELGSTPPREEPGPT